MVVVGIVRLLAVVGKFTVPTSDRPFTALLFATRYQLWDDFFDAFRETEVTLGILPVVPVLCKYFFVHRT